MACNSSSVLEATAGPISRPITLSNVIIVATVLVAVKRVSAVQFVAENMDREVELCRSWVRLYLLHICHFCPSLTRRNILLLSLSI